MWGKRLKNRLGLNKLDYGFLSVTWGLADSGWSGLSMADDQLDGRHFTRFSLVLLGFVLPQATRQKHVSRPWLRRTHKRNFKGC